MKTDRVASMVAGHPAAALHSPPRPGRDATQPKLHSMVEPNELSGKSPTACGGRPPRPRSPSPIPLRARAREPCHPVRPVPHARPREADRKEVPMPVRRVVIEPDPRLERRRRRPRRPARARLVLSRTPGRMLGQDRGPSRVLPAWARARRAVGVRSPSPRARSRAPRSASSRCRGLQRPGRRRRARSSSSRPCRCAPARAVRATRARGGMSDAVDLVERGRTHTAFPPAPVRCFQPLNRGDDYERRRAYSEDGRFMVRR